jgi:DNA polymerase-1
MNLYLIDGNSYFYRAFHAIRGLTNSKGFPTNAIYGFTNMIMKIIKEKKPDAVAIAFDSPQPTERHRIYEEYKAQRPETPDDLVLQIPHIKEIINSFNIPSFEMPGYEADDIICTIAKKAASQGAQVFILSGDKDMMQAVGKGIKIYDPMKDAVIDEKHVIERFGVSPERVPEIMAITGDSIDNIPGVKGIGEKTAKELLADICLDELIAHPEKIKNERIKKMISENIENIKLSRILATIDTNIPVDVNLADLRLKEPDWERLFNIFSEFEFKSLLKMMPSAGHKPRGEYRAITDKDELMNFLGETA